MRLGLTRLVFILLLAAGMSGAAGSNAIGGWTDRVGAQQRGHYEVVIRHLTWLIQSGEISDENLGDAYYDRGNAYYNLEDHHQAIRNYSQTLRLDPGNADAYYNRGNSYFSKGDYKHALTDYQKAYSLNPSDPVYRGKMEELGLLQ